MKRSDILSDIQEGNAAEWLTTPILVTSNLKRAFVNISQMKVFAAFYGLPIIRWKKKLAASKSVSQLDDTMLERLYSENETLWEYFVFSAPAMITENIRPELKLSNSTKCTMVSLTLADVTDANRLLIDADMKAIRDARPSDIIDLQVRPISLNVKVKRD